MAIQQAIHDVTEEIKIVKEKIEDEERQTPVDRDMLRALNQQLAELRKEKNRLAEVVAEALVLPAAGAQPGSGAAVFRPVGQQTFNDGMIQHTNAVVEDVRQELRQERQERRQEKQELTDRLAAMEEQLKQGRMHLKAH